MTLGVSTLVRPTPPNSVVLAFFTHDAGASMTPLATGVMVKVDVTGVLTRGAMLGKLALDTDVLIAKSTVPCPCVVPLA
jgi:hypothetical protein